MHNIKLILAYDGGAYLGWQKTKIGSSIEETLQTQLEKILQHPVVLQASSRTDAGVHAREQVVNFFTEKNLDLDNFIFRLNQLLPKDIVALSIKHKPLSFHPTIDCKAKEYHYFVCLGKIQYPHFRHRSWHVYYQLDLNLINEAIPLLIGTYSFQSFCNQHPNLRYTDYVRTIEKIECIEIEGNRLCFKIKGNHFLYKMVRNLVGTLIHVGRGKIRPSEIVDLLDAGDRTKAGVTAPGHGLFLYKVFY
ncbi:MAG: tRNA pseudouridine(38-40) synthase TruA [Parachlamydiaceae bacterium]|nr:tRNA pseudouridine(38-40) synthase TruA [Parachlamydiaceae bacterium]